MKRERTRQTKAPKTKRAILAPGVQFIFGELGGSEVTLGLGVWTAPGVEVGEAVVLGMPLILNGAVNMGGDEGAMVDVAITW